MPTKLILVLANSVKKHPGRCIAGREVILAEPKNFARGWIRPVSPLDESDQGELIPYRHCTLRRGGTPSVLDIVEVPLASQRMAPGQPENWQIQSGVQWNRVQRITASRLQPLVESPPDLWIDGGNRLDRISGHAQCTREDARSLTLIRPSGFRVRTWMKYNQRKGYDQRKTHGVFSYAGVEYDLNITDDAFTRRHSPQQISGPQDIDVPFGDNCLLCISLSGLLNDYHYKLIAAVIPTHEQ